MAKNVFIIDGIYKESCGLHRPIKDVIEEFRGIVREKYKDFDIVDVVGFRDRGREKNTEKLSKMFHNECAVLVECRCGDSNIMYFLRLMPRY